jgi:hypothetical protein
LRAFPSRREGLRVLDYSGSVQQDVIRRLLILVDSTGYMLGSAAVLGHIGLQQGLKVKFVSMWTGPVSIYKVKADQSQKELTSLSLRLMK